MYVIYTRSAMFLDRHSKIGIEGHPTSVFAIDKKLGHEAFLDEFDFPHYQVSSLDVFLLFNQTHEETHEETHKDIEALISSWIRIYCS